MAKEFKNGPFIGLREITEEMLIMQTEVTKKVSWIPTYTVPVVHTAPMQQNCKGGNIDACQNYAWCGQCINARRAETAPVKKTIIGEQDILDVSAYLEQVKFLN